MFSQLGQVVFKSKIRQIKESLGTGAKRHSIFREACMCVFCLCYEEGKKAASKAWDLCSLHCLGKRPLGDHRYSIDAYQQLSSIIWQPLKAEPINWAGWGLFPYVFYMPMTADNIRAAERLLLTTKILERHFNNTLLVSLCHIIKCQGDNYVHMHPHTLNTERVMRDCF